MRMSECGGEFASNDKVSHQRWEGQWRILIDPPSLKSPAPSPCEARAGEGLVPSNCRALLNPLSLTLSPLLRRGERESAAGMVVVSRCAPALVATRVGRASCPSGSASHRIVLEDRRDACSTLFMQRLLIH